MKLNIRAEFGDVTRRLETLRDDIGRKAMATTLNRIGDQTKTQAVREIRQTYNITAAKVRERIKVRRAFAAGRLAVEISVEAKYGRRATNLITFGAKQLKRGGVSVRIRRDKPPTRGRNWFILTNRKTGGTFVAKRSLGGIEPVSTIDVGQMFNANSIRQALLRNVRDKFPAEFERQVRFYTQRFSQ